MRSPQSGLNTQPIGSPFDRSPVLDKECSIDRSRYIVVGTRADIAVVSRIRRTSRIGHHPPTDILTATSFQPVQQMMVMTFGEVYIGIGFETAEEIERLIVYFIVGIVGRREENTFMFSAFGSYGHTLRATRTDVVFLPFEQIGSIVGREKPVYTIEPTTRKADFGIEGKRRTQILGVVGLFILIDELIRFAVLNGKGLHQPDTQVHDLIPVIQLIAISDMQRTPLIAIQHLPHIGFVVQEVYSRMNGCPALGHFESLPHISQFAKGIGLDTHLEWSRPLLGTDANGSARQIALPYG